MIEKKDIIDGICLTNEENVNEKVIFNFYSWTEVIKGIILKYTNKSANEIDMLVYNSPIIANAIDRYMSVIIRSHELEYHWAMILAYGENYWHRGISSEEPEGYFEWENNYRKERNLAEESFIFMDP